MTIYLPAQPNIPPQDLGAYSILVHGPKKSGKTSFSAQFPGAFIMQFEPGNSKALPVRQIDISTWQDCLATLDALEKNPTYCQTIIIDDVPSMYLLAQNFICGKQGITYPGDMSQGKGWSIVNTEFTKAITRIQGLPCGKLYTAHSEVKQADTRTGRSVATLETAMGRGADRCMDARTQIGVLIQYTKGKDGKVNRVMIIEGDDYITKAFQGLPNHFLDEKGNRIREIPMGNTAKEAYDNFIKGFNNKLRTGPEAAIPPASVGNNQSKTNKPTFSVARK